MSVSLGLWLAVIAYPLVAALGLIAGSGPDTPSSGYEPIRAMGPLLGETAAYAALVSIGAMLLGWAPGRALGRSLGRRGFPWLATALLVPACVPAYAVFYMWWQAWPADSALHAWAVRHDALGAFRQGTLVVGLLCWSWPLVAWCTAGSVAMTTPRQDEMLRLDGAPLSVRLTVRARSDAPGLTIGGLLVFLVTFDNTTCFDLAQVFSFGNELRARDALGASPREMLGAALPALGPLAALAVILWIMLGRRAPRRAPAAVPAGRGAMRATVLIWLVTVGLPVALLAPKIGGGSAVREFLVFYGRDLARSIGLAAVSGGLGALVAIGLFGAWIDHRRRVRLAGHVQAAGWLLMALAPATLVGVALEAAYNVPFLSGVVYGGPPVLVLAHLARFGVAGALLARWAAAREPAVLRDLRLTDGAGTLPGLLRAARPGITAVAVASTSVVAVGALGEVPVTARVHPPGANPLALTLLNDMHYQRPQAVTVALAVLFAAAVVVSGIACGISARSSRAVARPVTWALLVIVGLGGAGLVGCEPTDADGPRLVKPRTVFGTTGTAPGQFSYPRAIALDPAQRVVYVVDKTARVQRFDYEGRHLGQWRMPEMENGKPTGISVAPDGRVFVADTHYYRIIVYDADGREQLRFGRYGEGPGEFIYPTDVACGPDGRLYVSEYGGHDRIQVFSPQGEYLFEFGALGPGPGQFDRPQALLFDRARSELYVADSCNHRVVVVDPEGRTLRSFGRAGTGPGELHYPYGLAFLDDGTLLVAEFGNDRIQRFTRNGEPRGRVGRRGAGTGELRYPWGVAADDRLVFILDSGNNRVQVTSPP